jgi:hypothetical protein
VVIIDLLVFSTTGDYVFVGIFMIIGYLTTFYSKNMIVILCISLAITNVLKFGSHIAINREGFSGSGSASGSGSGIKETEKPVQKINDVISALKSKINPDNNIGESDMKSLQSRAQDLAELQKTLMQNMESLNPLLAKAEGFIEKYGDMMKK